MTAGQGLHSRPRPDGATTTGHPGGASPLAADDELATAPTVPDSAVDRTTGLTNRPQLQQQLDTAQGDSLLVIDLDDFRTVNEVLGYTVGDEVLRECARRLTQCLPPGAILSRIGDDEFAAVMTGSVDPISWADSAREALRAPMTLAGRPHTLTVSIGIALSDADTLASADLLQAADGALHRAKGRGGDRVEVFDPVQREQTRRRALIAQDLRRGLQGQQFVNHYQPQVSMTTGLITGVEALVRWEHPADGLVYPGAFVSVAEEAGLIGELGAVVLHQACVDAMTLRDRRGEDDPLTVSVNLSTVQMQDSALVGTVAEALTDSGLDPASLCLEVTESAVLGESLRTLAVIEELRELGVRFSIDDFGTGYSSLSNLRRLPVDELKIDRSFILAMDEPQGRGMVAAICSLATALELGTVAEGVDDPAVIAPLRGWGCDTVQGFLYFKPEPLKRVAKALRRDRPQKLPDPV